MCACVIFLAVSAIREHFLAQGFPDATTINHRDSNFIGYCARLLLHTKRITERGVKKELLYFKLVVYIMFMHLCVMVIDHPKRLAPVLRCWCHPLRWFYHQSPKILVPSFPCPLEVFLLQPWFRSRSWFSFGSKSLAHFLFVWAVPCFFP